MKSGAAGRSDRQSSGFEAACGGDHRKTTGYLHMFSRTLHAVGWFFVELPRQKQYGAWSSQAALSLLKIEAASFAVLFKGPFRKRERSGPGSQECQIE